MCIRDRLIRLLRILTFEARISAESSGVAKSPNKKMRAAATIVKRKVIVAVRKTALDFFIYYPICSLNFVSAN